MRLQRAGTTVRPSTGSAPRRGRRWTLAVATVVAGIAGAAGLVAIAPNASAAIVGMQLVPGNTASNSNFIKRLIVPCPDGMRALGGEMTISGSNQVRIAEIFPETSAVTFAAVEPLEGVSTAWSFSARAVCAPLSSLPGYQRIIGRDRVLVLEGGATERVSTLERYCPNNKSLIGFGGRVDSGEFPLVDDVNMSHVRLVRVEPQTVPVAGVDVPNGIRVDGNGGGYDGDVGVIAAGICVNNGQITLDESFLQSTSNSTNAKNVAIGCNDGTDTLIVSGFAVINAFGQNSDLEVGITAANVNRLTHDVSVVARESATGTAENWLVAAYSVCTT